MYELRGVFVSLDQVRSLILLGTSKKLVGGVMRLKYCIFNPLLSPILSPFESQFDSFTYVFVLRGYFER